MRYVIDCSVAFMWVVAEPDSAKALRLRDDFQKGIHELLAPDLFVIEIANSLLVAERRGRIAKGTYPTLLADVLSTPPRLFPASPLLARVAAITSMTPVTAYDCLYVVLAEREGCEFVTADSKLVNALQPTFPFIVVLSSLPS
jgi:predicted nucleic acid-binding protein